MKLTPLISGLVVLGIAGGMVATNPSRESYHNYAAAEMNRRLKEQFCGDFSKDFVKKQCENLLNDMGEERMQKIIADSTQRNNYFLFSIYQTEFDFSPLPKAKSYQFTTVGVVQNFWTIQAKQQQ